VYGGIDYPVGRSEKLADYEQLCRDHRLFDP
jgi:hypothetical protein